MRCFRLLATEASRPLYRWSALHACTQPKNAVCAITDKSSICCYVVFLRGSNLSMRSVQSALAQLLCAFCSLLYVHTLVPLDGSLCNRTDQTSLPTLELVPQPTRRQRLCLRAAPPIDKAVSYPCHPREHWRRVLQQHKLVSVTISVHSHPTTICIVSCCMPPGFIVLVQWLRIPTTTEQRGAML